MTGKRGKKQGNLTSEDWDAKFKAAGQRLAQDLGLQPKPKRKKDTVWVFNRPDPETGLIKRRSKERQRKAPKRKGEPKAQVPQRETPHGHVLEDAPHQHQVDEVFLESSGQSDDVESLLAELQKAFGISPEDGASSWTKRLESLDESWRSSRETLIHHMLELEAIPDQCRCDVCEDSEASVKCKDCRRFLCRDCDTREHIQHCLHDRQSWEDGFYVNAPIDNPLLVSLPAKCKNCDGEDCFSTRTTSSVYIAITMKGRKHIPRSEVICQSCHHAASEMEIQSIIENGFWPGSTNRICQIYSTDLLKWIDCFLKNMPGSSLSSIAKAIEDFDGTGKPINKTALSRALTEFRYCQHTMKGLKETNQMTCPACSHGQHSAHVDGNFKVYRYSKVPRGSRKPYYEGVFIDSNETVKQHMNAVYTRDHPLKESSGNMCGSTSWRAANSRSKGRRKLDECGLEVAGCRHAVAQKAVNMFTGEMYAYPHYIQVNFLLPLGVQYLWQDVICKYWPWAKKQACKDDRFKQAVTNMKPALSVMHAKAHQWSCQVLWGGRNQQGACAGAGEDMEQFFSYLSRLGSTTRNMSYAAREDTITEHVLFWNNRKVNTMAKQLCIRYKRNSIFLKGSEDELKSLISSADCEVNEDILQMWDEEVKEHAKGSSRAEVDITDLEKYFKIRTLEQEAKNLEQYVSTSSKETSLLLDSSSFFMEASKKAEASRIHDSTNLEETLCRCLNVGPDALLQMGRKAAIESQISLLQQEVELIALSIKQRKLAVSNLADSSKQRTKLRRKNELEKEKLQEKLDKVATLSGEEQRLTVVDAIEGHFPWHQSGSSSSSLPWDMKKKMVDLFVLVQRYREEHVLLRQEMRSMLLYLKKQLASLKEQNQRLVETADTGIGCADCVYTDRYVPPMASKQELKGIMAVKNRGIKEIEDLLADAVIKFSRTLGPDNQLQMSESSENESSDDSSDENTGI
ncbi:uncharacterized protein LOC105443805 isoform X2 [Strongylocentrotus purpuratus]|uniref:B box-type domain-containing protein n=1 Tax=Strongylocentrotus purpuratus TaxID=7668 RepID=A0A7M7SXA8_STRPU|nr:uncharacterized protein LOC105443805 isoform X2 [Strongylocentrotus purpuratus]